MSLPEKIYYLKAKKYYGGTYKKFSNLDNALRESNKLEERGYSIELYESQVITWTPIPLTPTR